jgi:hypothetical protein
MVGSLAMGITEVNIRNIQCAFSNPRATAKNIYNHMNTNDKLISRPRPTGTKQAFF